MSRIGSILIIFMIGLILTQYQFFSRTTIPQSILGNTTYKTIQGGLVELKNGLSVMVEKIFSTQLKVPTVETEPEAPEKTESSSQTIDRTILNAENILYYTNIERTNRGLKPLRFNSKLTRSANSKSKDMFTNQYFAHESPFDSKKTFAYFIDNESYQFVRVSENLAMGEFETPKQVVTAWMNSPDHRANILFPSYREIGASVQKSKMKGDTVIMIVEHFGIPKNVCPSVSESMLSTIHSIEQEANASKKTAEDLEKKINSPALNMSDGALDELIGTYNTAIRNYNSLVTRFQQFSRDYNAQVEKYDSCIRNLN